MPWMVMDGVLTHVGFWEGLVTVMESAQATEVKTIAEQEIKNKRILEVKNE